MTASVYRVVQNKVAPPQLKTFNNIVSLVKSFCVKLHICWQFNSYPYISTNFGTFILTFHEMALILPRVHIIFTLLSFEYLPIK